jgi:hypothetical protein
MRYKHLNKMQEVKTWSINLLWAGWGALVFTDAISWVVGIVGGLTLIWVNVEGAINHRRNRK